MERQKIKQKILDENDKKKQQLREEYEQNKEIKDEYQGECCFCFNNKKGAFTIQVFDSICILVPIRLIFAIWAFFDDSKLKIYAKVRLVTFWL